MELSWKFNPTGKLFGKIIGSNPPFLLPETVFVLVKNAASPDLSLLSILLIGLLSILYSSVI
jgi:hypothetical protein